MRHYYLVKMKCKLCWRIKDIRLRDTRLKYPNTSKIIYCNECETKTEHVIWDSEW